MRRKEKLRENRCGAVAGHILAMELPKLIIINTIILVSKKSSLILSSSFLSLWVFPQTVVPPKHPQNDHFRRKTHGFWGNPLIVLAIFVILMHSHSHQMWSKVFQRWGLVDECIDWSCSIWANDGSICWGLRYLQTKNLKQLHFQEFLRQFLRPANICPSETGFALQFDF